MLTVICPVYNEERYIEQVMDFCLKARPSDKEIIFIDGSSTDKTVAMIEDRMKVAPQIKLLHNPKRYVPYALNEGITNAKGEVIIRLDAHCNYSEDYFEKILEIFGKVDADIVGGPTRTVFHDGALVQEAVAHAICTGFGIGNSQVHQIDYEGYTDSVTFGAWKKKMFDTTGLFDTAFKRNQDDEFHYRAGSMGFKIFQHPDIKLYYYPRDSFKGLYRQYYQYGLYKPMVLRKVSSAVSWRHLIPMGFVLYLISIPIALLLGWYFWLIFLLLYIGVDLMFCAKSDKSGKVKSALFLVYPTIHFAYGLGFIKGLFKKYKPS